MSRSSYAVELRVGGRVLVTTEEHPFWVLDRGWVSTNELRVGDRLAGKDGEWTAVEGIAKTGEYVPVYNFHVPEDHTYFVGEEHWGFSVWAHNANPGNTPSCQIPGATAEPTPAVAPIQGSGGPGKVYQIPGSELTGGKPYIGKTRQPTVADRMKGKDHKAKTLTGDPPKADTIAENLTLDEMAGVEALLIEQRGLNNLTNKIPGLNTSLPKNADRLDAGRKVLGLD